MLTSRTKSLWVIAPRLVLRLWSVYRGFKETATGSYKTFPPVSMTNCGKSEYSMFLPETLNASSSNSFLSQWRHSPIQRETWNDGKQNRVQCRLLSKITRSLSIAVQQQILVKLIVFVLRDRGVSFHFCGHRCWWEFAWDCSSSLPKPLSSAWRMS